MVFVIGSSYVTRSNFISGDSTTAMELFLMNAFDYLNSNEDFCVMRTKGLNLDFKRSEQKDKLTLNISSFDSGFMGLFGFSGDEVFLNFDSNNGNGKLGLKIAKLKLANDEIQSILLDLNFLDLNQNALFSQNFYEILKANSKIKSIGSERASKILAKIPFFSFFVSLFIPY